jgi:hypothetical protein
MPEGISEHRNAGNFKVQETVYAAIAVTTGVQIKVIPYKNISFWVITGNVWIDGLGRTDLSTTNGIACTAGTLIEINTKNQITFMSDGTGATVQIIVWED